MSLTPPDPKVSKYFDTFAYTPQRYERLFDLVEVDSSYIVAYGLLKKEVSPSFLWR